MAVIKKQVSFRIHPDTLSDLDSCASQMRIDKTAVLELALNDYFRRNNCPPQPDRTTDERARYDPKG